MMMPKLAKAAMVVLSGMFWLSLAHAQSVNIRFPGEYSSTLPAGIANLEFKEIVAEKSGGDIDVQMFFDGSLYKGTDLLQAVLRGDVEMSTLISPYWPAISPRLYLFELPYAFPTLEVFRRATEDEEFLRQAYAEVEEKGGVVLGILPNEYLVPGTNSPIRASGDFKGLRLRSLGTVNLEILRNWGATPVSLNFVEVVPALQQGLIEGMNVPIEVYANLKLYESLKNVTYATYSATFFPWIANKQWWESLTDEKRQIIQEAVRTVNANQWDRIAKIKADSIKILQEKGVDLHFQTDEERAEWRASAQPIWDKYTDVVGQDLIEKLKSFQ
ncbi:MAG: TRAP transporter substrate-binding protein DctP [Rhizobiaceae bacterium]